MSFSTPDGISSEKNAPARTDGNQAAYAFDEKMGARAENWWLKDRGLKQRTRYGSLPLDRWTRWPASSSAPVPRAPGCIRQCTAKPALVSTPNPDSVPEAAAAETCHCTSFHQPGCFDFAGGVYSGGDHRSVATGNLKIIIGSTGYCENRKSCEFKNVYVAPHLDTAFPDGATVTAIATPSKGSLFARWGPGACRGKGATCSFKASKDSLHQRAVPARQADRAAAVAADGPLSGRSVISFGL